MWRDAAADKLYISGMNLPTTPAVSVILEYDIETDGSLTKANEYTVSTDHYSEGITKSGSEYFVVYHDVHEIHRFNSSFVFQEAHELPTPDPSANNEGYYQDIDKFGDLFAVNVHNSNEFSPLMLFYSFDGSSFTYEGTARPPDRCSQGFYFDGSVVTFAKRPDNDSLPPNHVVRATIAAV